MRPLFADPHHPYTAALLASLPERATGRLLPSIGGVVPGFYDRPEGCLFSPRCAYATALCRAEAPPRRGRDLGRGAVSLPAPGWGSDRTSRRGEGGGDLSAAAAVPVLEARDLARTYQLPRGIVFGHIRDPRRRWGQLHAQCRQDARGRRRIGLRQVHARPDGGHDRARDVRHSPHRRGRRGEMRADRAQPAPEQRSVRVSRPLRLAQPTPEDRCEPRGAA